MSTTQNIQATQWQSNAIDFNIAVLATNEQLLFLDEDRRVIKRSPAFGGIGEIDITENVKASVIINSDDVLKLTNGVNYTLYKITSAGDFIKLFDGVITVIEAEPPVGVEIPTNRLDLDTPYAIVGGANIDCNLSNNFYVDVLEEDSIFLFQSFRDGKIKTVKISNPNSVTTGLTFSYEDATIKWLTADGLQPAHPEGKTIVYTFQRWGDEILANASEAF